MARELDQDELIGQIRATVCELADCAPARLLPTLSIDAGRDTALRTLLGIPLPPAPTPRILGIDDEASMPRNHALRARYAFVDVGPLIELPEEGTQLQPIRREPS